MRSQYVFNYCWKDFPISSNHSSKSTDWLSEFQVLIFLEVIKASELVTRYLQQRKVIYLCFKVEKVFIRTSVFELEKIWHSLKMEQRSSVAAFCSCKVCILIFQKEKMTSGSLYIRCRLTQVDRAGCSKSARWSHTSRRKTHRPNHTPDWPKSTHHAEELKYITVLLIRKYCLSLVFEIK